MSEAKRDLISEVEEMLGERKKVTDHAVVPSTAGTTTGSDRLDQLLLPDKERGRMPLTKSKYLIRENPHLVQWEREVRKFLRNLSPDHEHRVAAVMVFEWATNIAVADLMAAGKSASPDLKKINQILRHYSGQEKGYKTWIAGRPVAQAYRIRQGFLVTRKMPMTLELYVEWKNGVLKP